MNKILEMMENRAMEIEAGRPDPAFDEDEQESKGGK